MDGRGRLQRASRKLLCSVAAVMLALPLAKAPAHAGPQLRIIRDRTTGTDPVTVRAIIYSAVPLGAYTLQLSFDPSVLELVGIGGGDAEFAAVPFNNPGKFSTGVVRFSAFQASRMDRPTGQCHVATFTFRPRVARARTTVEVAAIVLADTHGVRYQTHQRHKTVMIRPR